MWFGENIPMRIEIINKDDTFWKDEMEPKLTKFYYDCILPELIDPRHTRKMSIRDPYYIEQEIKNKNKKRIGDRKRRNPWAKRPVTPETINAEDTQVDDQKKQSKTIQELKEINFISTSAFSRINVQHFGELSDDEETYLQRRNPLAEKQLNFIEF